MGNQGKGWGGGWDIRGPYLHQFLSLPPLGVLNLLLAHVLFVPGSLGRHRTWILLPANHRRDCTGPDTIESELILFLKTFTKILSSYFLESQI